MKPVKQSLLVLSFLIFLFTSVHAQSNRRVEKLKADSVLSLKGEVYFSFEISGREEINRFTRMVSIENVKGTVVFAYANKKQFKKFFKTKRAFVVLEHPKESSKESGLMRGIEQGNQSNTVWNFYPTYTGYDSMMTTFQNSFPALCTVFNIGTLASGRKLLVAKISSNVNVRENKPQFLYSSTMHGNEPTGYVTMLHLIDYLLTNYGTDSRVTYLLDHIEIYINPLANPDGCYAAGNNTVTGATRSNANHVDLNRNYPDPQYGANPDGNSYQPETQAFMHFADSLYFSMSANFHTGAEVFNTPWDTWGQLSADDAWWLRMGAMYADTVQNNSSGNYFTDLFSGSHPGVTNGYAWYQVVGGRQDYMNFFKHCRESTMELSAASIPNANSLLNYWNYNYRSLLNYLQQSLYGIRGVVTDSCSGLPISAKVFISSHDHDSSHVYSNLPIGDYHRMIISGNYDVTFSAPGFFPKTILGIHVANDSTTIVNVELIPIISTAAFSALPRTLCPGDVQFGGPSESGISWFWDFGDGGSSSLQNPVYNYVTAGNYNVTLTVSNCGSSLSSLVNNYITVFPVPSTPTITFLNDTLFSSASTGNEWYFNGSLIASATDNFYIPVSSGDYSVTSTNSYGCISEQSLAYTFIANGIHAVGISSSSFTVFPNPSTGNVTIQLIQPEKGISIEIVNSLGQIVFQSFPNSEQITFFASRLTPGIYLVRLITEKKCVSRYLIRE